jgi:ribosomal protein S18 acetylase RimI-like enzyme
VAQVAAVVHRHPDKVTELYIDEVGVAPAWRRQRLARRMLDEMMAIGRAEGCGGGVGGNGTRQRRRSRPL